MEDIEPSDFVSVKLEVEEDKHINFQNSKSVSVAEETEEEYDIAPQEFAIVSIKEEGEDQQLGYQGISANEKLSAAERICLPEKVSEPMPTYLSDERKQKAAQTFTCDVCSAEFASKITITNHVLRHLHELLTNSIMCKCCGNMFSSEFCLSQHLIICQHRQYNKFITEAGGINNHIVNSLTKSEHLKSIQFVSQEQTPGSLIEESLSASESVTKKKDNKFKSHTCDVCSKSFRHTNSLKVHKRIHSGIKPYVCDVCSKTFRLSHHLVVHRRIHSGIKLYSCDVCSKSFQRAHHLENHKRIHSGVRPYSCDICSKLFRESTALKVHKRIHSGIMPYHCDICYKSFKRVYHLKRHKNCHL